MLAWKGRADRYVNTVIGVDPRRCQHRNKRAHDERKGPEGKLPHQRVKVSRGVASRHEWLVCAKTKREASASPFSGPCRE